MGEINQIVMDNDRLLLKDITEENIKKCGIVTNFSAARYDGKDTMSIEI